MRGLVKRSRSFHFLISLSRALVVGNRLAISEKCVGNLVDTEATKYSQRETDLRFDRDG
jgi:hypothetical protein